MRHRHSGDEAAAPSAAQIAPGHVLIDLAGGSSTTAQHHSADKLQPSQKQHQLQCEQPQHPPAARQFSSEHFWLTDADLFAEPRSGPTAQRNQQQEQQDEEPEQQQLPALTALRLGASGGAAASPALAEAWYAGSEDDGSEAGNSSGGSPTRQSLLHPAQSKLSRVAAAGTSGSSASPLAHAAPGMAGLRAFSGLGLMAPGSSSSAVGSFTQLAAAEQGHMAPAAAGQGADAAAAAYNSSAGAARCKPGTVRRWQAAAASVMALQRVATSFAPGSLQGLDVRRHNYDRAMGALHTAVTIQVIDFSNEQTQVASDITNASLPSFLAEPRPAWSKVRWINCQVLAEDARDLIDLIFNTISHNNNTSMQMLAVVSTIFLPITFIAGVYGTNFDSFFPEIHWQYGYLYFWGVCVSITVAFVALLKRWGMFTS